MKIHWLLPFKIDNYSQLKKVNLASIRLRLGTFIESIDDTSFEISAGEDIVNNPEVLVIGKLKSTNDQTIEYWLDKINLAKDNGVKIIIDYTDNYIDQYDSVFYKPFYDALITIADHAITSSNYLKSNLKNHFNGQIEIIEDAICERFGRYVDRSVELCENAMQKSKTREDLINFLKQVTRETQKPEQLAIRYARVQAIAMASQSERMKLKLGDVQERLTESLEDLFREARERGWAEEEMNPRAVAVLVQAYTFGHVVDDFTPEHMNSNAWYRLIDQVVEGVFFPPK